MDKVINFISDNERLVMTALFVMIIILAIAVFVTDYFSRKRRKEERMSLLVDQDTDVIKAFKENVENEEFLENTVDYSNDSEFLENGITEIKYVEENEELEKTKAQLELKNLKEELIKADQEERKRKEEEERLNNLQKTQELKIIDDIKLKENAQENIIDKFESEQEENAIISLEQFNQVSDKIYDQNELVQYKDDGNEPISIQELERLYNAAKEEVKESNVSDTNNDTAVVNVQNTESENKEETIKLEEFKFKKSPIISPVYGIDKDESINNLALENTANLDKLSDEIKKTNEFLSALKELRKNLD